MFKKYKNQLIVSLVICLLFLSGFVIGRYGKSAPNIEVAEGRTTEIKIENKIEPVTENKIKITTEEKTGPESKEMTITATAYCPCEKCCGKSDGITSTGTKATAGRTIAVDPSIIPYGTKVLIDGHTYIAEDCGGAVNGNRIDIFFGTHKEALDFGKKQINITLIEGD